MKNNRYYIKILDLFYRIFKRDKRFLYYNELLSNLNLSRKELLNKQEFLITELINHAYHNTIYYRNLLDDLKLKPADFKLASDLMKLPVLTKDIIKQNIDNLKTNDSYATSLKKVTSGGSTGQQAVVYKSKFYEEMSRASWLRNNRMVGWSPYDKSVWIWGSPIESSSIQNSLRVKIGIFLNRRIFLNAFNYSKEDFPLWFKRVEKFKPRVLYGYASIVLEFSIYLLEHKLVLNSIEIVVSTTEKLEKREVIEKAFGCKVYNQYGCREVIAIAIEQDVEQMLFTDDVVVVNTNDKNEFLLTPLYSYGFPLINYKVGDIGIAFNNKTISKKYPFLIANLKVGRITDNFLTQENRRVSSSALSTQLANLNLNIQQHQIIQSDYTHFKINYVTNNLTDMEEYEKKIDNCLKKYFGSDLTILFTQVSKIPVEKSGKKMLFKRVFEIEK